MGVRDDRQFLLTASGTERWKLTPAAERVLAEAEGAESRRLAPPRSRGSFSPKGPEPTRYGDRERNGIASTFEGGLPANRTLFLFGEYAPIRENKYIQTPRGRRWFAAALP
jgi:hypothetical protein